MGYWKTIGFGRLGPPIPLVSRNPLGQFAKLSDEVKTAYLEAAADAINEFTNRIARDSLVEVPRGPRGEDEAGEPGELAASIRYPGNDMGSRAHADWLWANIEYDTPYAHAQHEGLMIMVHHHPIIPGRQHFFERTGEEQEVTIEWEVRHHTTPGTKDHYLSDPLKRHIPEMEEFVGMKIREAMG